MCCKCCIFGSSCNSALPFCFECKCSSNSKMAHFRRSSYFVECLKTLLQCLNSACGAMFPFGLDSSGSKSVIKYLHDNHNYQTRITDGGKFQFTRFSIFKCRANPRINRLFLQELLSTSNLII